MELKAQLKWGLLAGVAGAGVYLWLRQRRDALLALQLSDNGAQTAIQMEAVTGVRDGTDRPPLEVVLEEGIGPHRPELYHSVHEADSIAGWAPLLADPTAMVARWRRDGCVHRLLEQGL